MACDDLICAYEADSNGNIGNTGDYVYADYDFDDPGGGVTWQEITLSHDDNGNLTADGLLKYQYDAWQSAAKVGGRQIPVAPDLRVRRHEAVQRDSPDSEIRRYSFAADC